uniref:Thioredoxin domain-containing protein n=1 Tax=Zooxanthella nutricula TaxID=1333877 RepID=A0A7S2QIR4_9DINO
MDQNHEELMQVNFDITMFDLPCKYLKLLVYDKWGEQKMNATELFHYLPVDHTGEGMGVAYTPEEIKVLEQTDVMTDVTETEKKDLEADWSSSSDGFHHTDFDKAVTYHEYTMVNFFAEWCVYCRKFSTIWNEVAQKMSDTMRFKDADGRDGTVHFMKMNCVDFSDTCSKAGVPAFPSMRLYKRDGTFEVFQGKRTIDNIIQFVTTNVRNSHMITARHHAVFNEGCQVRGTLHMPRVPGHFHMNAEAHGDVSVNPAYTNVSHRVNHLSFGDQRARYFAERAGVPAEFIENINPLDGRTFVTERFHEAPQHYLKVVSTSVEGHKGVFYQVTHTDRLRKLGRDGTAKMGAPQARVVYDLSPMSVVIRAKHKRWYEFLTSLFAILGGTYTVLELTSGAVDTVGSVVKEALGKAN